MSRYPPAARNAAIKCIPCNAPMTKTVEGKYVCVSCGREPIKGIDEKTSQPVADD
jgi:DNA-directed RNA polymerase subunit RPC12/RpoP